MIRDVLYVRQSLSRELASLQLQSPQPATRASRRSGGNRSARKECRRSGSNNNSRRTILKPRRMGRSIDGGGSRQDDSDTENIEENVSSGQQQQLVPAHKFAEVEKKCEDLTNKIKVGVIGVIFSRFYEVRYGFYDSNISLPPPHPCCGSEMFLGSGNW